MQWIEALINISALAGFIGVANLGSGAAPSPSIETNQQMDRI
jgi:hypothetical protein